MLNTHSKQDNVVLNTHSKQGNVVLNTYSKQGNVVLNTHSKQGNVVSRDGTDMKPSKLKGEGETKKEKEYQHDEL